MSYQPQLIVDLDIVKQNIELLANGKKPCLMVKASQYHVLENIDPLVKMGYDFFGVSTLEEALTILDEFDVNVLIVTPISIEDMKKHNDPRLHFSVVDFKTLNAVDNSFNLHLNFDTGMGRIGFRVDQLANVVDVVKTNNLELQGVYTHFPCANDQLYTISQIQLFKSVVDELAYNNINPTYIHCQNSLGCVLYNLDWCNMVRPGIGIWGYGANQAEANLTPITPSLKLVAPVSFIKHYRGAIGYDHLDEVDGTIVTIKMGYNDGLDRRLRGYNFNPGKIVGNICMCQTMLEVPDESVNEIIIFDGSSLYDIIDYIGCSAYEFLCGLSYRIHRVYKGGIWQN